MATILILLFWLVFFPSPEKSISESIQEIQGIKKLESKVVVEGVYCFFDPYL